MKALTAISSSNSNGFPKKLSLLYMGYSCRSSCNISSRTIERKPVYVVRTYRADTMEVLSARKTRRSCPSNKGLYAMIYPEIYLGRYLILMMVRTMAIIFSVLLYSHTHK